MKKAASALFLIWRLFYKKLMHVVNGISRLEEVRCEELEWKITHSINPKRGRVPKETYLIKVRGNNS
jgi:hypothetical protein